MPRPVSTSAAGESDVHVGPGCDRHRITGADLLWGNDYPHQEGAFPHSQEWVEKQFAGVPEDDIDRIVRRNAAEVFGFAL